MLAEGGFRYNLTTWSRTLWCSLIAAAKIQLFSNRSADHE